MRSSSQNALSLAARHRRLLGYWLLGGLCGLIAMALALWWIYYASSAISVRLTNRTDGYIHNLSVRAVGSRIDVGDLPVGAVRTVNLGPTSESGLTVAFENAQGKECVYDADVYLEPSSSGRIDIVLTEKGLRVNQQLEISPLKRL